MTDFARLIEHAFPLKQTSLDSVHEKNVRHGHISTLHIWPARRPLAACRAALLATLLPDPGTPEKRKELCEKIAGKLIKRVERKKMPNGQIVERVREDTEGGILHWGRETENADTLEWFRQEIRKAYGGRAPKVLDPFAGGGAIPLEAMRLGCEATAVDINPVAWFILKCTLEYPQKLAGQKRPLPAFILDNEDFMEAFYKANPDAEGKGKATKKQKATLFAASKATHAPDADLAWHVRAWGQWVLARARKELAELYPTYADFEPLKKDHTAYEHRPMMLVPRKPDGTADIASLNADSSADYLAVKSNPRWIAKPTVAYLWARTVKCKNCRADLPLLKTRWLCKKDRKRVLLTVTPNEDQTGVAFGIQTDVPAQGGNSAQKREHDYRLSLGTVSKAGARCVCCGAITTGEDIRLDSIAGRLSKNVYAVVVEGLNGKEYHTPTAHENTQFLKCRSRLQSMQGRIPFGIPNEPISADRPSPNTRGASGLPRCGITDWGSVFTERQLLAISTFLAHVRETRQETRDGDANELWSQAIFASLCCSLDRMIDFNSELCTWILSVEAIRNSFVRYALPFATDFAEAATANDGRGSFAMCVEKTAQSLETIKRANGSALAVPTVINESSIGQEWVDEFDVVCTDPPYYDAIPYSDIIDYFHVWLRRATHNLLPQADEAFASPLGPKWDRASDDGELVDQVSRFGGDKQASKNNYEKGMAKVFDGCHRALKAHGRLVVVFANKQPDAWETLVSALIRGGFVVEGTWPIQTEQAARMQAVAGAALASSVWLVCKKRSPVAKVGWDTGVLEEMRANIAIKLQTYWDAGIRGPDFIWAATGPALEAYSKHPAVKKADQPGQVMGVAEFLNHVRRLVVDYVVGKVLTGEQDGTAQMSASDRLDEPTAYYLLHRHDFGLDDAPVGTCILYAVSCGMSDAELVQTWDILAKTGADDREEDEIETPAADDADEEPESTGAKVRLKTWAQRKNKAMGYEAPNGRSVPLIDRVHRLMHLWKAGDVHKVDEYLDEHGMRRHELFKRLVQSLIELSEAGSDERSLMESLSNHIGAKGARRETGPELFASASDEEGTGE